MIARRRQIRAMYTEMLAGLEGVVVTPTRRGGPATRG